MSKISRPSSGKENTRKSRRDLECLIPAGELDEAALTGLVKQVDVKAVIDLLATWGIVYARPLTQHFKEFTGSGDMQMLEYALDTFYYQDALAKAEKPLNPMTRGFSRISLSPRLISTT